MPFDEKIKIPDENEYLSCIRCGLCLAVCPTYREYKNETDSPRGRVALARKSLQDELLLSPNLVDKMYSCLECLACNDICPAGIKPADIAMEMRQIAEQVNPTPWKNTLFGKVVARPNMMESVTWPLRVYENLGLRWLVHKLRFNKLFPNQLHDLEGMLPKQPKRPLRQSLPVESKANTEEKYRVGYFLGCAQSLMFSDESAATVRVLNRNGCTVVTPKETVCCGMPAAGYGRDDLVIEQAKTNIDLFMKEYLDVIVTDCATCGSKLREYGEILSDDPVYEEKAQAFSNKIRDISEFLMTIPLEKPKGKIDARVTYHDPCHLRRAQKVWKEPRSILQMIDGVDFVELPESDWCCGSAGSQLITHYETSTKVLDRKMENLKSTEADLIASGCPGCQMQLTTGIQRKGLNVKVVHPIQLLDQAYNNQKGDER
jgi:glycolate oxidase iron-sulfur subunit